MSRFGIMARTARRVERMQCLKSYGRIRRYLAETDITTIPDDELRGIRDWLQFICDRLAAVREEEQSARETRELLKSMRKRRWQ